MRNSKNNNGFSMIEVLIAIVLVGIAITSIVASNRAFTQANSKGTEMSVGEFLIEQIREKITVTVYDNLYSFDEVSYSPPINTDGAVLNEFATFSQQITVENVSDTDFEQVVSDGSSNFIRVTVKVFNGSREVGSASWIRGQY